MGIKNENNIAGSIFDLSFNRSFLPLKLLSPLENLHREYAKELGYDYDELVAKGA